MDVPNRKATFDGHNDGRNGGRFGEHWQVLSDCLPTFMMTRSCSIDVAVSPADTPRPPLGNTHSFRARASQCISCTPPVVAARTVSPAISSGLRAHRADCPGGRPDLRGGTLAIIDRL